MVRFQLGVASLFMTFLNCHNKPDNPRSKANSTNSPNYTIRTVIKATPLRTIALSKSHMLIESSQFLLQKLLMIVLCKVAN
ncbi:hypothetical protein ABW20_dc0107515 [Dactylellina cionopaga]|nr:hypothetical protein ABW20_dc0107515 [Dactylellina cionopaga]